MKKKDRKNNKNVSIRNFIEFFLINNKELSLFELEVLISPHYLKSQSPFKTYEINLKKHISTVLTLLKSQGKVKVENHQWSWIGQEIVSDEE
jgi:hypothetical protein